MRAPNATKAYAWYNEDVMQKECTNVEEMQDEARRFLIALVPQNDAATLVTLSGELGAGKTAFVKSVAAALGVKEHVTSPTFVIEKTYPLVPSSLKQKTFSRLVHIDAYRLETPEALKAIGFQERAENPHNIIFLEWPERVAAALPVPMVALSFKTLPNNSRLIIYD